MVNEAQIILCSKVTHVGLNHIPLKRAYASKKDVLLVRVIKTKSWRKVLNTWVYSKKDTMAHTYRPGVTS